MCSIKKLTTQNGRLLGNGENWRFIAGCPVPIAATGRLVMAASAAGTALLLFQRSTGRSSGLEGRASSRWFGQCQWLTPLLLLFTAFDVGSAGATLLFAGHCRGRIHAEAKNQPVDLYFPFANLSSWLLVLMCLISLINVLDWALDILRPWPISPPCLTSTELSLPIFDVKQ